MRARGLGCLFSLAVALLVTAHSAESRASLPDGTATPHTREAFVMGTRVTLTAYAPARASGLAQLERMLHAIEEADADLSTWRPESAVSQLNARAGSGTQVLTPRLCQLVATLDQQVSATAGAFDPAIGALAAAWDLHGRGRVPHPAELAAARDRSGWTRLDIDTRACQVRLPQGVSLDVGAFGKGEALDRVRRMAGTTPWLVNLGGQVAVSGAPLGQRGWTVGVADPHRRSAAVLELTLTTGSLATSAGSERDISVDGTRVGHILDPRTGRPAPFDGSVSVWAERALDADVLSTALYVMGLDEGLHWADARDVSALFLTRADDGTLRRYPSRAFIRRFGSSLEPRRGTAPFPDLTVVP